MVAPLKLHIRFPRWSLGSVSCSRPTDGAIVLHLSKRHAFRSFLFLQVIHRKRWKTAVLNWNIFSKQTLLAVRALCSHMLCSLSWLDHMVLSLIPGSLFQICWMGREQFKFGFQNWTFKLFSALMTQMLRIPFVMYPIHENKSNLWLESTEKLFNCGRCSQTHTGNFMLATLASVRLPFFHVIKPHSRF